MIGAWPKPHATAPRDIPAVPRPRRARELEETAGRFDLSNATSSLDAANAVN